MADYTYNEMLKMQNDAIKRVEEMQKRAPEGGRGEAEKLPKADGAVHRTPRFFVTVYARSMSPMPSAP